jgi:hypothetical protein
MVPRWSLTAGSREEHRHTNIRPPLEQRIFIGKLEKILRGESGWKFFSIFPTFDREMRAAHGRMTREEMEGSE